MIRFALISIALLLPAMLYAQAAPHQALAHVSNSFEVMVKTSYAETTTLFSPVGERAWAGKDWNPQFLYPRPEQDVEGAVFTVKHDSHESTWVNSLRDVEGRHFQYVYFIPETLVTVIDVRFTPVNAVATKVDVTYTRTALSVEVNDHVRQLGKLDRMNGAEWQQSIDRYLKTRGSASSSR